MAGGKIWVDGLTLIEVLSRTVERTPDGDAVIFPKLSLRWSYSEFQNRVDATARALVALGIRPGDHVGVWSTNWPQWLLLQFGAAAAGAVLVNINPAYRVHELAYVLKQADIKALFLTDRFKTSDYEAMAAEVAPELPNSSFGEPLRSRELPLLEHLVSIKESPSIPGIWPWSSFLEQGDRVSHVELRKISSDIDADAAANIQFTSGTTGSPKGATLSHRNLLLNAFLVGRQMRLTERDRVCVPVPFYHCFGCVMGSLVCVTFGAALVAPAESFEPEATLDAVEAEKCTALYGVPTMFNAEIHVLEQKPRDLSSLRTGIMAGSPCPIELMKQVTGRMHLPEMTIAYGLTEASPVITQTETSEPLDIRVSTVGRLLEGLEARLVDPATGRDVGEGEQGELWTRGPCVMLGYYKKPEETRAAINEEGWLRTGDLAMKTETGHYKITGRIKDMIIRGGENIYPREIEEFLLTHPSIRDAQIVGLPDEKFGEEVCAWIMCVEEGALDEEEVRRFCREHIAHYKVPRYVVFVQDYPLTVSGKVQKFRLRELGVERFGLERASSMKMA